MESGQRVGATLYFKKAVEAKVGRSKDDAQKLKDEAKKRERKAQEQQKRRAVKCNAKASRGHR